MHNNTIYPILFILSINILVIFIYPLFLLNPTIAFNILLLTILYQVFLTIPFICSIFSNKKSKKIEKMLNNKTLKKKFIVYNIYSIRFWKF